MTEHQRAAIRAAVVALRALADVLDADPTATAREPAMPEWATVPVTAKRFGVSDRAIADAGRRGDIETSRVGKRTVVLVASVERFIASRTRVAAVPKASNDSSTPFERSLAATRAHAARRAAR